MNENLQIIPATQICCYIYAISTSNHKLSNFNKIQIYQNNNIYNRIICNQADYAKAKVWKHKVSPLIFNLITEKYLVGNTFNEILYNLKQFDIQMDKNQMDSLNSLLNFIIEFNNQQIIFSMYNTKIGSIKPDSTKKEIQSEIENIRKLIQNNNNYTLDKNEESNLGMLVHFLKLKE